MSQMCPNCSFDNPDEAQKCSNCPSPLRGLLGYRTTLGGRYQVISVLGCGAMGAVYLAEDKRLVGRRCAIKENRPDPNAGPEYQSQARDQFLAEASVLGQLDHPGLPKVSDYFIEDERQYLVMDYVEGEDLESTLLRTRQPQPEDSVLYWSDQVLDALAYLHNRRPQPIIHRDIKPANIRVNLQGKAKLVDFGLVKLLDSNNPKTKAELRGIGTPAYAPLEQFASSDDHTDARSDIYALGATMYHLLTNLYPPDVHQRLLNPELLTPPRRLNPLLTESTERVILQAMEIYPNQRFQSAEDMRLALRTPATSTTTMPAPKPASPRKSAAPVSAWLFGLVGLLVVLLILGSVSYLLFGLEGNNEAVAQTAIITEGEPTFTPTPLIVQSLGDAPTDTPTPVVEAPTATEEPAPAATDTPTSEPTTSPLPTPTPRVTTAAAAPAAGVPASSLVGTIAYPVFNGTDFDIYFGQADGSGTRLYRKNASQPAFSPDGSRIAFHSWRLDSWGLTTMSVSGANPIIVANFVEDQLPTWSPDGSEIVLLSRRAGDRKSRLIRVGSFQDRTEGVVIGEGEYPTLGLDGRLVFKGWGNTAPGLRSATISLGDIQVLTSSDRDTAPAPSPDGQKIAFMSQQEGNWDIYIVSANGSNLQRLTDDPAEDGLPAWSPDGKVLAFASYRGGSWGIWAMTPTGADQQLLFEMEGSPDGFVGRDSNTSRGWTEERISWTR
ncbi:MAG: serine/threonine-protein kinase [Anaerolineae bacterium]|nr:serine/threonine-protein kinase [Anaerolineae bacterium]